MTSPLRIVAALVVALIAMLPVAAAATPTPTPTPTDTPELERAEGCVALDLMDGAAVNGRAARVRDVFLGLLLEIDRGRSTGANDQPRQSTTYTVVVRESFRGSLSKGDDVKLVLTSSRKGTGPGLEKGEVYVFFTQGETSPLRADTCDGYVSAKAITGERIEQIKDDLAPKPQVSEVVISKPADGGSDAPDLGRVVAPGGAISLIGILGLVLISRVGRQRH